MDLTMRLQCMTCALVLSLIPCLAPGLMAEPAVPAAPEVKVTQPENDAADVSCDVKEIVVTFDQDMDHGGFSFVGGGPTFPKTSGNPFWRNARECVLPVELSPGQSYVIGINSARRTNFRNANGVAATPFSLRFTTRTASATPSPATPVSHTEAAQRLRKAIEARYSHRETRLADWAALWSRMKPGLEGAKSAREFPETAGQGLAVPGDPHIWLEVNGELVPAFRRDVSPNVSPTLLPGLITKWTVHNKVLSTDGKKNRWDEGQVGEAVEDGDESLPGPMDSQ
jgi:hypothetical protein